VKESIDPSLDHLRPWMPWAEDEPQTVEQKTELLRGFRSQFDGGENFVYGIFTADESQLLGGSGLHPRIEPGGLEVGYWVRAAAARQGIATESTAAITRVGFEVCEADRIEIRIEPRNEASKGVPRKLGFVEEATLRRRLYAREDGPLRDVTIFTMFREDCDPALAPDIRAYDARGERLI
jgi:RimJ/RimL family protein N-acetyltransferase